MIVNWDFYVRRKRINVKAWLERKNIKNYKDLIEVTKKLGIETPPEEKVSKYFEKPEVKKNDKKIKKPAPKSITKHGSKPIVKIVETPLELHKKTKTNSTVGVYDKQQQDIEGQEKPKPTRKRKPRRKRKPVKKED